MDPQPITDERLSDLLRRVPSLADPSAVSLKRIGGRTNANYLVVTGNDSYVVRVCGSNAPYLGVDRRAEREILRVVGAAGIGPEVVFFCPEKGDMVTRFINGRRLAYEEYIQADTLRRVVHTVKRVHRLGPVRAEYSPFDSVRRSVATIEGMGAELPARLGELLTTMACIERSCAQAGDRTRGLCHNDLFAGNLLDDGSIRLIDWEFSGMGDVFFDLGSLVLAYSTQGLPPELRDFILKCYFGDVNSRDRAHLKRMTFMVLLCTTMWALLHHALIQAGHIDPSEDYDYLIEAKGWIEILAALKGDLRF
jgi:thiamine kinase-like enzyme